MAQFDYKKYLKEGGVEKYLTEVDFPNDPQGRYDFIRPLMSRLPDTSRTEYLIDALEDALADYNRTDDLPEKMEFDNVFIEIMKALGMESELAEADSLVNPEAEEIEATDLDAAADYFDSLAENDDVLDEMLDENVFDRLKAKAKGAAAGAKQVAKNVKAGVTGNKDDIQSVKGAAQKAKLKSITDDVNKDLDKARKDLAKLFKGAGDDDAGGKFDPKVLEMAQAWMNKVKELKRLQQNMLGGAELAEVEGEEEDKKKDDRENTDRGENRGFSIYDLEEVDVEGYVQTEEVDAKPGMVQKSNILGAINLLNHIQYEYSDAFTEDSMDKVSDVIVMLNQVMKQQ